MELLHAEDSVDTRAILNDLHDEMRDHPIVDIPDTLLDLSLSQLAATRRTFDQIFHALNVAHNFKIPINNIIDDIFYRIFLTSVLNVRTPARQSLSISHVCRHWRRRALDYPILWGYMDPEVPLISKLFLERSGQAPIHVFNSDLESPFFDRQVSVINPRRPRWLKQMPMVVEVLSRLRYLSLFLDMSSTNFFVEQTNKCLNHLQLYSLNIGTPGGWKDGGGAVVIEVPAIFVPENNHIRRLTLQTMILTWHSPPVRQLTQLCIVNPSFSPTYHQLISIISSSPNIEELVLLEVYNSEGLMVPNSTVIQLERLWRLRYRASNDLTLQYLQEISRHIRATNLRSIDITSDVRTDSPGPPGPHAFLLIPEGNERLIRDILHLEISQTTAHSFYLINGCLHSDGPSLSQSGRSNRIGFQNSESEAGLRISGRVPILREDAPGDFTFLHQFLRTASNVRRLELVADGWNYLGPHSGVDIASAMPNLSILEIHGDQHFGQFGAQRESTSLDALVSPRIVRLDHLVLRGISRGLGAFSTIIPQLGLQCLDLSRCPAITSQDIMSIKRTGLQIYWSEEMTFKERNRRWGVTI